MEEANGLIAAARPPCNALTIKSHTKKGKTMYRISTNSGRIGDHTRGGLWRVLPGDDHEPTRIDNRNTFFPTKRAAQAACNDLNR